MISQRRLHPALSTLLPFIWLCCNSSSASSDTLFDPPAPLVSDHSPHHEAPVWEKSFQRRILNSWVPSEIPQTPVNIRFGVGHDCRIYELKILQGSGSAQLDLDCVQAILGAATFATNPHKSLGSLLTFNWVFDSSTPVQMKTQLFNDYYQNHPEAKDMLLVFTIPLDVISRYPGLFSEKELVSKTNLLAIDKVSKYGNEEKPKDNLKLTDNRLYNVLNYYASWQDFFESNAAPTRDQVQKFSQTAWQWK